MNMKKQIFTEKYLDCRNATEAAAFAGYGKKHPSAQGQRLLKDPKVKAAIEKAFAQSEEAAAWNARKAIEEFERIEKLALDGECPNYGAAVKSIENICRIKGLFAPEKQEIEVNGTLKPKITFEQLCNDSIPRKKIRDTGALGKKKA
jgi:phage terminase small subunit